MKKSNSRCLEAVLINKKISFYYPNKFYCIQNTLSDSVYASVTNIFILSMSLIRPNYFFQYLFRWSR